MGLNPSDLSPDAASDFSDRRFVGRMVLVMLSMLAALGLGGCALTAPPATVAVAAPPQWYAPLPTAAALTTTQAATASLNATTSLPHNGSLTSLSQWWQQQHDPLLVELIDAAQLVSPSVITARSNIQQAQAAQAVSRAALLPTLDAIGGVNRSLLPPINRNTPGAYTNAAQLGLQTNWEVDLFGQNEASLNADRERFQGTQASWHEARVLVAAETANLYYSFRACEKQLLVVDADARSRLQTSRLNEQLVKAGFVAPATAALARATAAEGNSRLTVQRAECELIIKALVAMTAWSEPELRQKLAQAAPATLQQGIADISSVPAEVLGQRPDVYSAARELTATSFEVGSARAQRYPRLSLGGTIARNKSSTRGFTQNFDTWSLGPLSLTIPLYDGGAADANVDAAKARYEEAAGKYRGIVRQAVREVEEALVNLQSTADRGEDTLVATLGYSASFSGTEARYKAGLASLVELEDARRTLLAAQSALVSLERERRSAWIALYRALGGGWSTASPPATPMVFGIPQAFLPDW
jgi:NodT family efflux transporter outer membrane factor (OMF) lipoprotein